ncbi:MAG: hypothetical protein JXR12_05795 [Neptunomonas phycophila]|uniref:hypothetical protein n=1 Tax=Neptunomonas phycophila TaxID=1572645 RepID=UPI003B8C296B
MTSAIDTLKGLETAKEEFETGLKDKFASIMEQLLTEHGARYIAFKGYTPYFNDGDPCEHSDEGYMEWNDEIEGKLDSFDWYEPTELADAQALRWNDPKLNELKDRYADICEAINMDIVSDTLQLLYDTNFVVLCGFDEDGKFRMEKEFYNPEY